MNGIRNSGSVHEAGEITQEVYRLHWASRSPRNWFRQARKDLTRLATTTGLPPTQGSLSLSASHHFASAHRGFGQFGFQEFSGYLGLASQWEPNSPSRSCPPRSWGFPQKYQGNPYCYLHIPTHIIQKIYFLCFLSCRFIIYYYHNHYESAVIVNSAFLRQHYVLLFLTEVWSYYWQLNRYMFRKFIVDKN